MEEAVSAKRSSEEQGEPKKVRKRNARGEGERLRAEIIEAAIRLLSRLGSDEPFSLRAVAKEAHITAPSIYIQFEDKAVLLLAVIEELFRQIHEYSDAAELEVMQQGGGPWEVLLARSRAFIRFGLEQPGHYRVLYDGRAILRLADPRVAAFGLPVMVKTGELMREVCAEKQTKLDIESSEQLALLLFASLHGIVSLHINKPTIEWPPAYESAEFIARALLQYDYTPAWGK